MAGCESFHLQRITGSHIKGFNSHGVIAVRRAGRRAVEQVIDAAKAVTHSLNRGSSSCPRVSWTTSTASPIPWHICRRAVGE